MGGSKPLDTCWRFAKKNTGPDNGKFPWIDLWGKKHSSNATRFKLYLAFDCKEFKAEQPVEHNKIMRALSEENIKERSKENKATWAAAQAAALGRAASTTATASFQDSHMPNAVVAAGSYHGSVLLSGYQAAQLRMRASGGQQYGAILPNVDTMSKEEAAVFKDLQAAWIFYDALKLNVFDSPHAKAVFKFLRPSCVTSIMGYETIRYEKRIHKAFLEVQSAVDDIQQKEDLFIALADGWTNNNNGEYLLNTVKVIGGVPFFHGQPTPQSAGKCDARWHIDVLDTLLKETGCCGLQADNCATMQDFKAMFVAMAKKLKHAVWFGNCSFHGFDSVCGQLIGETMTSAKEPHVLESLTGPPNNRREVFSMDVRKPSSVITWVKAIVKAVKGRSRVRTIFKDMREMANNAAKETWRQEKEAMAPGSPPPKLVFFPNVVLPGKTRKLSIVPSFTSVVKNKDTLNNVVRSAEWEKFMSDVSAQDRAELAALSDGIKAGGIFEKAEVIARLLGILHMAQRQSERNSANLSDSFYNWCETRRRLQQFSHELITQEVKVILLRALDFRFSKVYTPSMALAVMLDARRQFSVDDSHMPNCSIRSDALECLKKTIAVFPSEKQHRILEQYNSLVGTQTDAGTVFDFYGNDAAALAAADDMPQYRWWRVYAKDTCDDLAASIAVRILRIPASQASVERINSQFKYMQQGRVALTSTNARELAFIYINARACEAYYSRDVLPPGTFKLGAGWAPATDNAADAALDDVTAAPRVAEDHTLADALARLEEDDEEGALAIATGTANRGVGAAAAPATKQRKRRRSALILDEDVGSDDEGASGLPTGPSPEWLNVAPFGTPFDDGE